MNILFISYRFYPDLGGIEVNSEILANHFCSFGAKVCLVTTTDNVDNKRFLFTVVRKPDLIELIRLHRWADVVFENNPSIQLSWPNLLIRKPLVIAVRTWIQRDSGKKAWQDHLKFLWLKRAQSIISVSSAICKEIPEKSVIIGNPYRKDLFYSMTNFRNKGSFVFVGRLVSDKGADLAIRAFFELGQKINDQMSLAIIGDGLERINLEFLSRELGIENKVFFKGSLRDEDLVLELNKHQILLVPSRWKEPFGNVALEGIACGCIPIVSDGGGLSDAIGGGGLVFKRNDLVSLIECMERLLMDDVLRERLLKQGKEHLKMHYPDIVAKKYYDQILKILS